MVMLENVLGFFNQGGVPTVTIVNKATMPLGVDLDALIAALGIFVERDFGPVWETKANLVKANDVSPNTWNFVFFDDADAANALGYHDLTKNDLPLSKVFVRNTLEAGEKVSTTASHELAEMLADPAINIWAKATNGVMYAYETSDAVEETSYEINGIAMSNFVHPAYFESFRRAGSVKFDHLGLISKPLEILKGGYMLIDRRGVESQVFKDSGIVTFVPQDDSGQIVAAFADEEKAIRFMQEDRRQHRSSYRLVSGQGS